MKIAIVIMGVLVVSVAVVYMIGLLMPVKHHASVSRQFPVEKNILWQILTDYRRHANWRRDIVACDKVSEADTINEVWQESDSHGNVIRYESRDVVKEQTLKRVIISKHLAFGGSWTFDLAQHQTYPQALSTLTITENGEVYNPMFRFIGKYVFGFDTSMRRFLEDLDIELQRRNKLTHSAVN